MICIIEYKIKVQLKLETNTKLKHRTYTNIKLNLVNGHFVLNLEKMSFNNKTQLPDNELI